MKSSSCVVLAWASLALLAPQLLLARVVSCQQDPKSCKNPDKVLAAADLARSYDKLLGAGQSGARYQFSPNKHYVLEGAERLAAAGLSSFKFKLQPEYTTGAIPDITKNPITMVDQLQSTDFPYLQVLDLPFRTFQVVVGSHGGHYQSDLSEEEVEWYQQVYDVASFLINRYKGSGKTFYLGGWRGDYQIRSWLGVDPDSSTPHPTAASPIDPERVALYSKLCWELAAAVDDARSDAGDNLQGVQVYSFVEINLAKNDTVDYTIIDDIIPNMDPVPDYISVSLSSMPQYVDSVNPADKLYAALDHVQNQLPGKDGVPGPRVLVGEYEFGLRTSAGVADPLTPSQELQAQHSLAVAAAAIGWGAKSTSYTTLCDSTSTDKNTAAARTLGTAAAAAAKDGYQDRGVGLIDREEKESLLFAAFKAFTSQANEWLESESKARDGSLPCQDEFRQWAVDKLVQLANDIDTGSQAKLTAPAVINKQDCESARTAGTVVV